jgi:hypothetical protein
MTPPARRLHRLSLACDGLAVAGCFAFLWSDPRGSLAWIWFATANLALVVARACQGFSEMEAPS